MRAVKKIGAYLGLFSLVLALACAAQYLAGLVPQQAVRSHLLASMEQLQSEGLAPGVLYAGHPRSKLDNLSENYILTYSYYMDTRTDPASVLTNPGRQIQDPYDELFLQTEELAAHELPSDTNYVRYFLGFRMYVRPMLALMNYMDARQCILWTMTLLFAAVLLSVYRVSGSAHIALAFAFAFSQLNPIVIASCYQYSAVFFIAFAGMLLVPLNMRPGRPGRGLKKLQSALASEDFAGLPALFFVLGMATQILDFYTPPLLTYGLPVLMAMLVNDAGFANAARSNPYRLVGVTLAVWLAGYVGAWFGKMLLTTLLTPYNALYDGLSRLMFWMRPDASGAAREPFLAAKAVFYNFINIVDPVPLALEGALLVVWVCALLRRNKHYKEQSDLTASRNRNVTQRDAHPLRANLAYLLVALLPIVWFVAAAKPSYEQFYFQYRILGMFLFGGLVFLIRSAGWDRSR